MFLSANVYEEGRWGGVVCGLCGGGARVCGGVEFSAFVLVYFFVVAVLKLDTYSDSRGVARRPPSRACIGGTGRVLTKSVMLSAETAVGNISGALLGDNYPAGFGFS